MKESCINIFSASRKRADLSQEEAAWKLNISTRTLSDYENGANIPGETIVKMMEVYSDRQLGMEYLTQIEAVGKEILPNYKRGSFVDKAVGIIISADALTSSSVDLLKAAHDGSPAARQAIAGKIHDLSANLMGVLPHLMASGAVDALQALIS